jgi:hypothetical protein
MTVTTDSPSRQIRSTTKTLSDQKLGRAGDQGDAIFEPGEDAQKTLPAASPLAKSWTHFIAGGYVEVYARHPPLLTFLL